MKKPATVRNPAVTLYHVNRRQQMQLRPRDKNGRAVKGMDRQFDRFVRCHYTGKQNRMNPRLARIIYETGRHYPGRRIEVVSGYRHPKFAKNPRSPHMKGLACDFRVAGIPNAELREYLRRTFTHIGVGYYPNSSFIHLDVRAGPSAFWIDYSGPGEKAMYSESPQADIASGRADKCRPEKIDKSWATEPVEPASHVNEGAVPDRPDPLPAPASPSTPPAP